MLLIFFPLNTKKIKTNSGASTIVPRIHLIRIHTYIYISICMYINYSNEFQGPQSILNDCLLDELVETA